MDQAQTPPRTHLFTMRVWLEDLGEGQTEWRGEVQYVVSGEVRYFRDWRALVAMVQAMLPAREGYSDGQPKSWRVESSHPQEAIPGGQA